MTEKKPRTKTLRVPRKIGPKADCTATSIEWPTEVLDTPMMTKQERERMLKMQEALELIVEEGLGVMPRYLHDEAVLALESAVELSTAQREINDRG
jgi:hypothetical protein